MSKAQMEQRLKRIGARRQRHSDEADAIQEAVGEAVQQARGVVPMERVAELLNMHRSSLYELYLGGGDGNGGGSPAQGTGEGEQGQKASRRSKGGPRQRAKVGG